MDIQKTANKVKSLVIDYFIETGKCSMTKSGLAKVGNLGQECDDALFEIFRDLIDLRGGVEKIAVEKPFENSECKNCGQYIEHYFKGERGWRHFVGDRFHYHCDLPDSIKKDIHAIPDIMVEESGTMVPEGGPVLTQALHAMKRNIEIAKNDRGATFLHLLTTLLNHRSEVAQRLLKTARSKDTKQVEALHRLFDYDQDQLRQLLGLILEE